MLNRNLWLGVGIGAMLAFMADPRGGRRRRALVRDRFVRAGRKTRDALDATGRDLANRTSGIIAATRSRWADEAIDDQRLFERVRAALGRISAHPHAIRVDARDGYVTLRGPILASEADTVVAAIGRVRGVKAVMSDLEPHESAEGIPALQGAGRVRNPLFDVVQRRWSPATQALVTAAGLATAIGLAAYARR